MSLDIHTYSFGILSSIYALFLNQLDDFLSLHYMYFLYLNKAKK